MLAGDVDDVAVTDDGERVPVRRDAERGVVDDLPDDGCGGRSGDGVEGPRVGAGPERCEEDVAEGGACGVESDAGAGGVRFGTAGDGDFGEHCRADALHDEEFVVQSAVVGDDVEVGGADGEDPLDVRGDAEQEGCHCGAVVVQEGIRRDEVGVGTVDDGSGDDLEG